LDNYRIDGVATLAVDNENNEAGITLSKSDPDHK
jgi:hypothetical protein